MSEQVRKLHAVWEDCFRSSLTRPGFANLVVVLAGWVLTRGTHAVTEALVVTDVARRRHWEAFHRFFSRGAWDPDLLGRWVFERLRPLAGPVLRVVIDDTVAPKKGPHVFGIGSHLDAVRSTRARQVFVFGHCWVVLAVLVRVPLSTRAWALPVLFRLYRNKKECEKRNAPYAKKTELARALLDLVVGWVGATRIEVAIDSAYCNDTVTHDLPAHIVVFGSMRVDAVLTHEPGPRREGQRGRRRKRGDVMRKPEQLACDGRTPWQTTTACLYGKETTVRFKSCVGQWYRAMGTRLVHVIVVECTSGRLPVRVFFSTDVALTPSVILETYSGRWGIEVFFRDAKQLLGFADSQARKEAAVLRVAPLVGLLYSTLVVWFANDVHTSSVAKLPHRPWYRHKQGFAFQDVLRAAQRTLASADILDLASSSDDLQMLKTRRLVQPRRAAREAPRAA